jgi:hypothetical protein
MEDDYGNSDCEREEIDLTKDEQPNRKRKAEVLVPASESSSEDEEGMEEDEDEVVFPTPDHYGNLIPCEQLSLWCEVMEYLLDLFRETKEADKVVKPLQDVIHRISVELKAQYT